MVIESGHSRFPMVDGDKDKVIGILLAKDLLRYLFLDKKKRAHFNLHDMLRPAVFVPESKRLNVLLREFRTSRNHMAIVVDEYGGVAGTGDHRGRARADRGRDRGRVRYRGRRHDLPRDGGEYVVKALTPLADFNARLNSRACARGNRYRRRSGHEPSRTCPAPRRENRHRWTGVSRCCAPTAAAFIS